MKLIAQYRRFAGTAYQQQTLQIQNDLAAQKKALLTALKLTPPAADPFADPAADPTTEHNTPPALPAVVASCLDACSQLVAALEKPLVPTELPRPDFAACLNKVSTQLGILKTFRNKKNILRLEHAPKLTELDQQIAALRDRQLLAENRTALEAAAAAARRAMSLEKLKGELNSKALTIKMEEARRSLVDSRLENELTKEISELSNTSRKPEISFKNTHGSSSLQSTIRGAATSYNPLKVMSEGEQKCLSLSFFLAELTLSEARTPVVFDDPVTSLDHRMMRNVAQRLLELSQERQVIILTHSIVFFSEMAEYLLEGAFKSVLKGKYELYGISATTQGSGLLKQDYAALNFEKAKKEIDQLLKRPIKLEDEAPTAKYLYGQLRQTIELYVEKKLFGDIVGRYRANIRLNSLIEINGSRIDAVKQELRKIFERCCRNTEAHSNPLESDITPSLDEFKQDYHKFSELIAT